MTSVHTLFPRTNFIGFDHILHELDRVATQANENYPPHNVVKVTDTQYTIELAVAGFSRDEIEIEVNDRTLTVLGEHITRKREYVHKGISTKKFTRTFRLSEYVQVVGADLADGLLAINLEVVLPEEKRPRKIDISTSRGITHDNHNTLPGESQSQFLTEKSDQSGN